MKNRVGIVTGGAGHIGQDTCRKLAAKGVHPIIADKDNKRGQDFAQKLKAEFDVQALFLEVDMMDPACFQKVREQVEKSFGRLDYIVNNAAFYDDTPGWGVPYEQEGYEAWMKVMRVNLLAPFFLTQALTPLLQKSEAAAIVNVSSIYGVVGPDHRIYEGLDMTNPAAYSASKGGLLQLTKWMSTVLAPNIRVNAVTPGGVERGQNKTFIQRYENKTPLGRMATEQDISGVISFLLSPEAAYITGQNIIVDGGWTVW